MGYTAPTTRVDGEFMDASDWNTDVTNNIAFLANPPACRVRKAALQTISTGSDTAIQFDTERFDTDSMHSTVTNNTRITFNTAGIYVVAGSIRFASNSTGVRQMYVRLNGATPLAFNRIPATAAGSGLALMSITTLYKFAATDYVELIVYQDSGGNLDVTQTGNDTPEFGAVWVGLG